MSKLSTKQRRALEEDIQPVVVNWVRSIDGVLAAAPALGAQP